MIFRLCTLITFSLFTLQGNCQNKKELLELQISRTDSLAKIIQKIQTDVLHQELMLNSQKLTVDSLNELIFRFQNEFNTANAEITSSVETNRLAFSKLLDSISLNKEGVSKRYFFLNYSNQNGEIIVPKGKSWYIGGCFAGMIPVESNCEPKVMISKINSTTFSNLNSSLVSRDFFNSQLDMYLPEGTKISFLVYEKCHDADYNYTRKISNVSVTFNIIEYTQK